MSRGYVFADESGNFDFSRTPGASRYFILTAITLTECDSANRGLQRLRHDMAWEGHDHAGPFHAAQDPAPVRDRVFRVIESLEVTIDSIIVEKAKAMPKIRLSNERFYQHALYYLLKFVVPRTPCSELLVVTASIGSRKRMRDAFHHTVRDVMKQVASPPHRTASWLAHSDACLQIADYCGWAMQRKWEAQEEGAYSRLVPKIRSEFDLFAQGRTYYY